MLLLASTSDKLRVTTSAATTVDVHASWVDLVAPSTVTPGRTNTAISTATTTDVVASPASSTYRTCKSLHIRNRHASTSNDITVIHTDGTTPVELIKVTLAAGDVLAYDEGSGWSVRDNQGNVKYKPTAGTAIGAINVVILPSDVTNNNASANTIADVTALSFAVVAGQTYWFHFSIPYTAAATSTGSRWSINGPATPTNLAYTSRYPLTATTETFGYQTAYDTPASANATSLTTGNIAIIEGYITPASDGTVIARFASEVSSSAIVAKAGAVLQWARTL